MLIGGLIVVCLAPVYSCAGKGYLAQPVAATPFGILLLEPGGRRL